MEWITSFSKGKQLVLVGLVVRDQRQEVYKIALSPSHQMRHEQHVMTQLWDIPHMCRQYAIKQMSVNVTRGLRGENPFADCMDKEDVVLDLDVLFMEYVQGCTLWKALPKLACAEVKSLTKRLLTTIYLAQRRHDFTHYDLHTLNILVRSGHNEAVETFYFGDEQRRVKTHGYDFTIIDFEYSHVREAGWQSSLRVSTHGVMPILPNFSADIVRLCASIGWLFKLEWVQNRHLMCSRSGNIQLPEFVLLGTFICYELSGMEYTSFLFTSNLEIVVELIHGYSTSKLPSSVCLTSDQFRQRVTRIDTLWTLIEHDVCTISETEVLLLFRSVCVGENSPVLKNSPARFHSLVEHLMATAEYMKRKLLHSASTIPQLAVKPLFPLRGR